jgi:hypothetical protein
MQCERCEGQMLMDHYMDMEESGALWLTAWRCLNCGNVVDEQILEHRLMRHTSVRRARPIHLFPRRHLGSVAR